MSKNVYFALVEFPKNENEAFGISFVDFPGCFSAADTFQDIFKNAKEALESYLELLSDDERANIVRHTFLQIEAGFVYEDYVNKAVILIEA